jgi:hypothetical protein
MGLNLQIKKYLQSVLINTNDFGILVLNVKY